MKRFCCASLVLISLCACTASAEAGCFGRLRDGVRNVVTAPVRLVRGAFSRRSEHSAAPTAGDACGCNAVNSCGCK